MKSAPASMAAFNCSLSITVPAPSVNWPKLAKVFSASTVASVRNVISAQCSPALSKVSASGAACCGLSIAITGIICSRDKVAGMLFLLVITDAPAAINAKYLSSSKFRII